MATTAIGNDATDLGSILQAAMAGSYVAHGSAAQSFTVSTTIVIYVNSTTQGPLGLDLGGGTIYSNITDGSPVIQIVVGPGVDLRYLTFANLTIQGNGHEGAGIQIVAAGNDRWVYNFSVNNVTVNHVGGYGLDLEGSVFEGIVSNSWMTNNAKGGAYITHLGGGQASALHWFGGGFQNNGGAGMMLDNGVRDMSVDGVKFVGNAGGGISAGNGITSVSHSDFQDNHGQGVWFQNYGNFTDNAFESSGAQNVGITGWQNGGSTVVGNVSTWTGSGADPTTLANLQGYGSVYATADTGKMVTGSSLSLSGFGGGDTASVTHSSSGISLPGLSPVTSATTAALAATNTGNPVETALKAAAAGTPEHLTDSAYTVSSPIVVHLTSAYQGAVNIDFGGAKIQSNVTGSGPVIEIIVDAGVNVSQLTISNLMINGNGSEGDGIKIVADGSDRSIQKLSINSVNVEHVGGIGLDVIGNVHGQVFDSWMNGNNGGGARFANGPNGGVADGLSWTGGGFRHNSVAGLILDNGTKDMTVKGAYFVENPGVGIDATSGITLVKESGFENNGGTAIVSNGSANIVSDTFSTWGPQQVAVGGYLNGGTVSMSGIDKEYYGSGSDTSVLANVQGSGTVAVAGGGPIIAGSNVTVTGSTLTASGTPGVPSTGGDGGTTPVFTGGSYANGQITVTGTTPVAGETVWIYDGSNWVGGVTSDASGRFSFSEAAASGSTHSFGAIAIDSAGNTTKTSTPYVYTASDTSPGTTTPLFTGGSYANGQITVTGTTPVAGETVWIYDGNSWMGGVTSDASGKFSFSEAAVVGSSHSFGAIATDSAGTVTRTAAPFIYTASSTTAPPPTTGGLPIVTEKLVNDTGASATDGITANAALTGTADPHAVVHFTVDGMAVAATATANASGVWNYTPTGLSDGFHTVVASETNAAGATGAATIAFTYDTHAPIPTFTGESVANGKVTLTGTTGEAGDTVSIYDGNSWAGFATTGADGTFTFTANASAGVHSYGANASGPLGEGHGTGKALLGTGAADTLVGTGGNDVIVANGGNDVIVGGAGADKLSGGSGNTTFVYNAASDSTAAAADVITDFHHGDKIDFTAIAGIGASNGVPTFQGYLTGTGNQTISAHSVAVMEVGGNTQVLVNTSSAAETVTATDTHAADMKVTLVGVNLGVTGTDFHHS